MTEPDVVDLNEVNRQVMLAVNGISQGNAFDIEIVESEGGKKMEYRQDVKIYLNQTDIEWLDRFPPRSTLGGSVTVCAEWGIAQMRRGARTAFLALDHDERKAIALSLEDITITWDFVHFGAWGLLLHLEGWFRGDGLIYTWEQNKISALLSKIKTFTPSEAAGIVFWGYGYWEGREDDIDKYVDNFDYLI